MTPEQLEERIRQAFPDCDVAVIDATGTQDHFDVRVASKAFQGQSRIAQHKSILALFDPELKTGEVHALAIKTIVKG